MKLLTTEQLRAVARWFVNNHYFPTDRLVELPDVVGPIDSLIAAECRAHGYAGIKDAYRVLIEKES